MSHPQTQNNDNTEVRKKIGMTPPVKGTFKKNQAKLTQMLKTNRANRKTTTPKAK